MPDFVRIFAKLSVSEKKTDKKLNINKRTIRQTLARYPPLLFFLQSSEKKKKKGETDNGQSF
jgi:hypothetical protein